MTRTAAGIAVAAIKASGARVLFSRVATEREARALVDALARLGLAAEIRRNVPDGVRPGGTVAAKREALS